MRIVICNEYVLIWFGCDVVDVDDMPCRNRLVRLYAVVLMGRVGHECEWLCQPFSETCRRTRFPELDSQIINKAPPAVLTDLVCRPSHQALPHVFHDSIAVENSHLTFSPRFSFCSPPNVRTRPTRCTLTPSPAMRYTCTRCHSCTYMSPTNMLAFSKTSFLL